MEAFFYYTIYTYNNRGQVLIMTKTIYALYDGKVLHPEEQIELEPNTRIKITIQSKKGEPYSFLRMAESANLVGPDDLSEKFEEYLYNSKNDEKDIP